MNNVASQYRGDEEDFDDDCDCACHDGGSHEYRLMRGASIEGISIRDVVIDKHGKIASWSFPVAPPSNSVEEIREELEFTIKELEELRPAFDKPILDETTLEAEMESSGS